VHVRPLVVGNGAEEVELAVTLTLEADVTVAETEVVDCKH
jgi:hypothetical protein